MKIPHDENVHFKPFEIIGEKKRFPFSTKFFYLPLSIFLIMTNAEVTCDFLWCLSINYWIILKQKSVGSHVKH